MSSSEIYNKIRDYLHNSPSDHITAFSVIFQLIEYDTWYSKDDLREIIHGMINEVKSFYQQSSGKYLKLIDIPLKVSDYYFIRFIFPNDDSAERYPIVKLKRVP